MSDALKAALLERARAAGFDDVRVAPAAAPEADRDRLLGWLAAGLHGEMDYMARWGAARADAATVLPGARSVLVFAANHYPLATPPLPPGGAEGSGGPILVAGPPPGHVAIAKYAVGEDYHVVLRERLAPVLGWLAEVLPNEKWRVCVDSAPLLERAFAVRAGIGFAAKNTMVISPRRGSYFFIACIATTALIEPDAPIEGTCGTCTRCLEACPTQAIIAPHVLDARRCISYQTIERRSEPGPDESVHLAGYAFGCDICQDVCPYNKFAVQAGMEEFRDGRVVRHHEPAATFAAIRSNREFARRFARSPLRRAGRRRLQRHAQSAVRGR
ncbi:MAG: tRNA epoxyqueuosine(34) reductase QueG [Candidatus Sumerlaeaceae bacterium]|nr:tRNA epoxyqueuosine(34) reductase QueG [Candidatus Sumerlaeaceae bacterium]